ncbi:hypothetical protein KAV79_08925 [Candidatus Aerophobetes bacterium]|nr:hypothetical protein [Candidatus Aerophobetes bacterium]
MEKGVTEGSKVSHSIEWFHDKILVSENFLNNVGERVCRLFDIQDDEIVAPHKYEEIKKDFIRNMSVELKPTLCSFYLNRLFHNLKKKGKKHKETYSQIFDKFGDLYGRIVKPWIPLYISYVYTVVTMSEKYGIEKIMFLARDAIPFFLIACQLKKRKVWTKKIRLVEINRDMIRSAFGMMMTYFSEEWERVYPSYATLDDIKGTSLCAYIMSIFNQDDRIAWVETGFYGTILKILIKTKVLIDPLTFFFSSRNPNIFGYTNAIITTHNLRGGNIPYSFIIVCGDTIETRPKFYSKSRVIEGSSGTRVIANIQDPISVACSFGGYREIIKGASEIDLFTINPEEEILNLYNRFIEVRTNEDVLPVVLPAPTKKWKYSSRWCKEWNLGPIPPMDEMIGPKLG